MGASSDLADARQRAARVLTAFEAAVKAGGAAAAEASARDCALLKRAVAIQNGRAEAAAAAAAAEVAELRAQLAAGAAALQAAQLHSYSLSVHLRQALAQPAAPDGPGWVT